MQLFVIPLYSLLFNVRSIHVLCQAPKDMLIAEHLMFPKTALSELQRGEPRVCEQEDTLGTTALVTQQGKGPWSHWLSDHSHTLALQKVMMTPQNT